MKVLLIHKHLDTDPYEGVAWYGWWSLDEYFDDNVPQFIGKTREEALEDASRRLQELKAKHPHFTTDDMPNFEAEMAELP